MKKLIICSLTALCACASTSGALGSRADADSIAGQWRGVLLKGDVRSVADFQFAGRESDYRGTWWGRELAPVALSNVQLGWGPALSSNASNAHPGNSIHFEVPQMGVFDGLVSGETIEGTFKDGNGGGSFRLEKQPAWDDPRFIP
jgi:hypothetical protein